MSKLSIQFVARNEEKYIPFIFASLKNQTFKDWEMTVVDNASTDGTAGLIEKESAGLNVKYKIIKNEKNTGFSAGHNQASRESGAEYVLLLNADMHLMPDALQKMVEFLDEHHTVASVTARLMRWDFSRVEAGLKSGLAISEAAREGFTSQIDSLGIKLYRNRRALEWLSGYAWAKDSESAEVRALYEKPAREVFGVSGAIPMYRRSVLNKILLPGDNLFDPTYHSYKEDLDLSYRLQNAGFTSYVLLETFVYHDRTSGGPKKLDDWSAIRNKERQSYFVRFYSYKNHLRTLYKNEYWQNFILDFPIIFWHELKKFAYILFTDPAIIVMSCAAFIKDFSYTRAARAAILKTRRMHWRGIRRWL